MKNHGSIVLGVLALTAAGCSVETELFCGLKGDCVRGDQQGVCLQDGSGSYCAFSDDTCPDTRVRWDASAERSKLCVSRQVLASQTDRTSGTTSEETKLNEPCGPCMLGRYELKGDQVVCGGVLIEDVTESGVVSAVCRDDMCDANFAVDDKTSTSWFSRGSDAGGKPSFSWSANDDRVCLTEIAITGNQKHFDPQYRTGHGFYRITVQAIDSNSRVVVSDRMDYPHDDRPAPHALRGVWAKKLRLVFTQHESEECGGFSELKVFAARAALEQ